MAKPFKTLDDMGDIRGKTVLVREDLNVPMQDGSVSDDTRLRAAMPTILELADRGAKVLILAHFGRPKGQKNPEYSLSKITRPLTQVLGRDVQFIPDCCGEAAVDGIAVMRPGDISILENTRFHPGEEKNDPALVEAMAAIGAQRELYSQLLSDVTDEQLRSEITMIGRTASRGALMVTFLIGHHIAYRTQLFLYLKACGREELSTMNLWAGVDAPVAV